MGVESCLPGQFDQRSAAHRAGRLDTASRQFYLGCLYKMGPSAKTAVLMLSVGGALARAGAAPDPVVTPAAILPRDNTQTLGWYSDAQTAGQTICTFLSLLPPICRCADKPERRAMGLRRGRNDVHFLGQLLPKMRDIDELHHVYGLLERVYDGRGHFHVLVRENNCRLNSILY